MRKPLVIILAGLLLITLSTTLTIAKNNIYFINNPNVKPIHVGTKLHDSTKLHVTGKTAEHNILITQNGKTYAWGNNGNGQLGFEIWIETPKINDNIKNIIQNNGGVNNILTLETGRGHSILILKNGKVYVCGWNSYGELGLGDWMTRDTPTENSELEQLIQNNGGVDNISTLETGYHHNILIFKNGKVYVWGYNDYGQLGLGDTNDRNTPTENTQLEQIIQDNGGANNILTLKAGEYHNVLIFKNGKAYVWGGNDYSQLGLEDTIEEDTPTENTQLEQIIQDNGGANNILTLKVGEYHNILIFKNGKVYAWGGNGYGQLGLGDYTDKDTPTENTQLEQIIQDNGGVNNILTFKTGKNHNVLIFKNGKVYVWGANWYGQLGLGDYTDRETPTENTQLEQIIQNNGGVDNILTLETGWGHNILIFKNGKVYVWGNNYYGQLGLGDYTDRETPTENTQLEQIIQDNGGVNNILTLETGYHHNILIFKNEKVYVWGDNSFGQLGLGYSGLIYEPLRSTIIEGLYNNIDNIMSIHYGYVHTILLLKNGKVYVWGYNRRGQLGLGDTIIRDTPTENTQLEQIIQDNGGVENILTLETGEYHNVLIFKNNKVYVWGDNWYCQLGLGDTNDRNTPTENTQLEQIIQDNGGTNNILTLKTGARYNILIFKNGKVYVWGYNKYGQLGLGNTTNICTPTENSDLEQIIQDNGGVENILTLETGWGHNILIFKNGKVYVWGDNNFGQLGLGYRSTSSPYGILTPTENSDLEQKIQDNGGTNNILTLKTGAIHNILIFKNGKVYVWGANGGGQLGLGDWTTRDAPTENTQLEQIIQQNGGANNILTLETGYDHNILIFKNSKVYVWGVNVYGKLGLGDTNYRNTPIENSKLEQVILNNGGIFLGSGGISIIWSIIDLI